MFTIDQTISDLHIRERNLLKVFFSMNNHQVATPEMMLEEARSYILFVREPDGRLSAYIGLHLLKTDRRLYYTHASNPFPFRALQEIEEEALAFVEGLGALLDTIDFTKMSPELRSQWIDKQEIFGLKTPVAEVTLETEVQAMEVIEPEQPANAENVIQAGRDASSADRSSEKTLPKKPVKEAPAAAPVVEAQSAAVPAAGAAAKKELAASQMPPAPAEVPIDPRKAQAGAPAEVKPSPTDSRYATPVSAESGMRTAVTSAKTDAPARKPDVMQNAINAGIVKPPKTQIGSGRRETVDGKKRDRESLARLLSSF